MKFWSLFALVFILFACSPQNDQENSAAKLEQEVIQEKFQLLEFSRESNFFFDIKIENEVENDDQNFAKALLNSLDSSLTKLSFNLHVRDESLITHKKDTLEITVYDLLNKTNKLEIKDLFKDDPIKDRSIGLYEAPVTCRVMLIEKNICAVCIYGMGIPESLDRVLLKQYLEVNFDGRTGGN